MKKALFVAFALSCALMAAAQVQPRPPGSSQITGVSGNGHTLATVSGPLTQGHGIIPDGLGNLIDSGSPAASGGTYPPGNGVPQVSGGTSYGATYNASNLIPANFVASPFGITSTCTVASPGLYQNQTGGAMSCTLPAIASGTTMSTYWFAQGSGNTGAITLTAPSGTTILIQGVNTAAAGTLSSSGTAADLVEVIAYSTTQYVAVLGPGIWNGITQGIGGGAVGSLPYQSAANTTAFIASPTTSGNIFAPTWQPSGSAVAPVALNLNTWNAVHAGLNLNYVANVGTPAGTPSGSGGTVAASTTNFAYVTCLDAGGVNQTAGLNKSSNVTTTGTTSSIAWTWTAVTGCTTYRVWVATTGTPSFYFTSASNSFTQIAPASSGTSGTFPTFNTTGQLNLGGVTGQSGLINLPGGSSTIANQGICFGTGTTSCIYGSGSNNINVNASTWFVNGNVQGTLLKGTEFNTAGNCSSSASPAVCSNDAAGSVVIASGATSVVVGINSTTVMTGNSQIVVAEDQSLGTKLSVTCDTTSQLTIGSPLVSARVTGASSSFTISTAAASSTNPVCLSYWIIN